MVAYDPHYINDFWGYKIKLILNIGTADSIDTLDDIQKVYPPMTIIENDVNRLFLLPCSIN
jgi:hypothetical protein